MNNKIKLKKITIANSMLEWVKIIKDAVNSGKTFRESYRNDFVNDAKELDDYYFYVDHDYNAYALEIQKHCNIPELGIISGMDIVSFIINNKALLKDMDKLLKLQAFL